MMGGVLISLKRELQSAGVVFGVRALQRKVFPLFMIGLLAACASADVPGARNVSIPGPTKADQRRDAINEKPDSVMYLPLGSDVLVPEAMGGSALPSDPVGPFELRSETLAGALQLVLAEYEIPLAFETEEGLTRTVTVANLRGPLGQVVNKVCSLADLYCSFEDGTLIVKDTQTFTVTLPPLGGDTDILAAMAAGVQAITGATPITEAGTRTIIYEATNRTSRLAERYFQKLRANTALIVYEVYIWQVDLNSANSTGIDWEKIDTFGAFGTGISIPGGAGVDFTPISIGLPTRGDVEFGTDDVLQFISTYGAVKTISQPQITVLSGSQASLRVADTINYVSSFSQSVTNDELTVSTETDSVDTGFTLTIASAWDNATVYGTIELNLQEAGVFTEFPAGDTVLQLPETSETELSTQVRIRPGDSLLIAGLVTENDNFSKSGPGLEAPVIPTSRQAEAGNSELVILLRPRVIVYTSEGVHNVSSVGRQEKPSQPDDLFVHPESQPGKEEDFSAGSISHDMMNPAP
jgi:hypothetical protein